MIAVMDFPIVMNSQASGLRNGVCWRAIETDRVQRRPPLTLWAFESLTTHTASPLCGCAGRVLRTVKRLSDVLDYNYLYK
jgi:hypothetical protein